MPTEIEFANQYFLVPFKDQSSLHFIGDRDALNALLIVMDATIVATAGIGEESCYVIVDLDESQCEEVLKKASEMHASAVRNAKHEE